MFALLVCPFMLVQPVHGQQQITIRFVDYRSGHPIKNFYLVFEAWSGKRNGPVITKDTLITRENYSKKLDGKVSVRLPLRESEEKTVIFEASTRVDRDGKLTIYFPETLPEYIRVSAVGDLWSSSPDFDPSEVIKAGEVVPFHDHVDSRAQFSRTPGEIVIVSKKRTTWDRMRQEIP
jgi:hypothetical protein